ncbi:2-oxoacid:acceptor oxidoreductase family protein [Desulfobacterales bacterium HSG17]|nr:2-oxoacid:acceptor oxidoreductase family protein [Desulfobacterales bacterium HSG17]
MKIFNIHITGVGGQGIGLLSQALLRGLDHARVNAIAVDTHGLAQRGGVVVSQIRCGEDIHSPVIMKKSADLVLGMEVHEAMRGFGYALKKGGTLVYLDVSWQPLGVRLGKENAITAKNIQVVCEAANSSAIKVDTQSMEDTRMQNMALLGTIAKYKLVPGVTKENYYDALEDLLTGEMLTNNKAVFALYAS